LDGWQQLTDQERRRLKKLLSLDSKTIERLEKVAAEDEKMEWLWAMLRRIASTVAIILGAFVLFWEQLKAMIRSIVGQ